MTLEFMKNLSSYLADGGRNREYLGLFEPYKGFITGDITPGYSTLSNNEVKQVKTLLGDVKIILCVREPVGRLWSQLNMHARKVIRNNHGRVPIAGDINEMNQILSADSIKKLVVKKRFDGRSFPTRTHDRWLSYFGENNMLVINFEDLTRMSEKVIDRVCRYVGVATDADMVLPPNTKENKIKIDLDVERREILEEFLGEELGRYANRFEHHPNRV